MKVPIIFYFGFLIFLMTSIGALSQGSYIAAIVSFCVSLLIFFLILFYQFLDTEKLKKKFQKMKENIPPAVHLIFKVILIINFVSLGGLMLFGVLRIYAPAYVFLICYFTTIIPTIASIFLGIGAFKPNEKNTVPSKHKSPPVTLPKHSVEYPKETLDDPTYIEAMNHSAQGAWHVFDFLIDAKPYGWQDAVAWAAYMNVCDLINISEICVGVLGGNEKDITNEYIAVDCNIFRMPSIETERGYISVAGISKMLAAPVKIVWTNQSRFLKIYTLLNDEDALRRYAETAIRRTFGTDKAMMLGRPRENVKKISIIEPVPVKIDGQNIYVSVSDFVDWTMGNPMGSIYERTASILLTEKEPTIVFYEDGKQVREYTLQTEGDEDFSGKYFQISVRLASNNDGTLLTSQVDGFISDTPETRKMTYGDIGYRMEGHILRSDKGPSALHYEKMRGQDLVVKGLKYPGYTIPSGVRLVGICPDCKKSFAFHGYCFYMMQEDVAYSDDGLDVFKISAQQIDKNTWSAEADGKTFRYYNSFCCPHCGTPYIDYKKYPENKVFGVAGCVHLGRKAYGECD